MRKTLFSIALAAVAMLPNVAQAQPIPLSVLQESVYEDGSCSDFAITAGGFSYFKCFGVFSGNDNSATVEQFLEQYYAPEQWNFNGKTDFDPFQTTAPGGGGGLFFDDVDDFKFGTLNLDGSIGGRFALGIKYGRNFSLYLFNTGNTEISSFEFDRETALPNGLSHSSTWGGGTQVPEPATFGLVAAGMIGLAGVARRRRNQA